MELEHSFESTKVDKLKEMCFKGAIKVYEAGYAFCNRTFEEFQCWKEAYENETVYQECPDYVEGFDPTKSSSRTCMENGSWSNAVTNATVTDFSQCVTGYSAGLRQVVNFLYMGGYIFGTAMMMLSLLIFWSFRTILEYTRVRVHVNLFVSVIITNITWMLWYNSVLKDTFVILMNPVWCQVLHVVTYYTWLCCTMWMFCEGIYLYACLAMVFSMRKYSIKTLFSIGWGFPAGIMAFYSGVRIHYKQTGNCWTESSVAFNIITIPTFGFLFISLILLLATVAKIYYNFKGPIGRSRTMVMAKASKAALIMGYTICFIFCFSNLEVQQSFRNMFQRFRRRRQEVNIAMVEMNGPTRERRDAV